MHQITLEVLITLLSYEMQGRQPQEHAVQTTFHNSSRDLKRLKTV